MPIRRIVPMTDDIEMAADDQRELVVYYPDGARRMADRRADDAARQTISHAGATKDRWIGEKPYLDWDCFESPEDLTAEDLDAKEEEQSTGTTWSGRRRPGVTRWAASTASWRTEIRFRRG